LLEDVKPVIVSTTDYRFSGYRLTSLVTNPYDLER